MANKTKVIPNKECIILTHNLLKLYISNLNQIHLQSEDESDLDSKYTVLINCVLILCTPYSE
jgi:hypothetical protein